MNARLSQYGYWALSVLFVGVLAAVLVTERWQPSAAEQPAAEEWPEEIQEARNTANGGRNNEASEILESLIEERPDLAIAHFELAELQKRKGSLRAAEQAARKAVALDPREMRYRVFLSELYREVGWLTKAEIELGEILVRDPDNLAALQRRSEIYFMTGRQDRAIEDLDFAVTSSEGSPESHYSRAQLLLLLNDRDGGKADIDAIEASEDPTWMQHADALKRQYGL